MQRYRFLILNGILLLTVAGATWGRRTETMPARSGGDFLRPLPLPFRGWKTSDNPLSQAEREMLRPDAALIRRYQGQGNDGAELAVIAGRRKETVHTPGFCMAGGGWELLSRQEDRLRLPGGDVPVVRSVMAKEGARIVLVYFFSDGERSTRSLPRYQGEQLIKRLRGQSTLGALVRIIVPVGEDTADAERLVRDFAAATVPPVLAAIRAASNPFPAEPTGSG